MYVLNQKINNLEEKISVLDNFSQSIFNFVTSKEETKKIEEPKKPEEAKKPEETNEVTYSNTQSITQPLSQPVVTLAPVQEESETEDNQYTVSNQIVTSADKMSETNETKEILSDMVSELKNSLIETKEKELQENLDQVNELKEELSKNPLTETENTTETNDKLFDLLTNTDIKPIDNDEVLSESKKKENDLHKMNLSEIKALAKEKNIPVMTKANKSKKKEALIQEILQA
jgi:hypothetical protein